MVPDLFERAEACLIKSKAFCLFNTHTKEAAEEADFLHERSQYPCTIALWTLCTVRGSSLATESLKVKNVYLCIYS